MITITLFTILFLLSVATAVIYRDVIKFTPGLIAGVALMWLLNGAIAYCYPSVFQALAVIHIPCQFGLLFVKGQLIKCLHF